MARAVAKIFLLFARFGERSFSRVQCICMIFARAVDSCRLLGEEGREKCLEETFKMLSR